MRKTSIRLIHSLSCLLVVVMAFQLLTFDYDRPQAIAAEENRWQQAEAELAALKATVPPTTTTTTTTTTTVVATSTTASPTTEPRSVSEPGIPTPTTTTTTTTTTTLPPTTTAVTLPPALHPGDIPADTVFGWLTIADLGKVDVALIEGMNADNELDIDKYALDHGVAHRSGTAYPGSGGNVVIAGHRTSAEKDVFRNIGDLQPGQLIEVGIVWNQRQDVFIYQVEQVTDMIPNDEAFAQRYFVQQADYETLTLITCTPPGKTSHRLVVLSKLVQINGQNV